MATDNDIYIEIADQEENSNEYCCPIIIIVLIISFFAIGIHYANHCSNVCNGNDSCKQGCYKMNF